MAENGGPSEWRADTDDDDDDDDDVAGVLQITETVC